MLSIDSLQNGGAGALASVITNNGYLGSSDSIMNRAGATLNSNTTNSVVTYEGTLTNNGTVNMQGRIGGSAVTNSGGVAVFNVVGNLNLNNSNPLNAFTNQNSAVLNVTGGTFWVDALNNTSAGTGATLTTAGVQVAADGAIDAETISNTGGGTMVNAGTLTTRATGGPG